MEKEGIQKVARAGGYRPVPANEITRLLNRVGERPELFEEILPLVYDDLKRISHNQRAQLGAGPTMQTTALVHEACLKLRDHAAGDIENRLHLKRLAAIVMRQLIFDYARRQQADKRGGAHPHDDIEERQVAAKDAGDAGLLLAIERVFDGLQETSPRMAEAAAGRFFIGLSIEEIGEMLGVSRRTVTRDLTRARAWLKAELADYAPES